MGTYSLLSHNGNNMPKALLNRKKMGAQLEEKSIVQCRIINSRAEELGFEHPTSRVPGHTGAELTNSCRIVSSPYPRASLELNGRSSDKARYAGMHLPQNDTDGKAPELQHHLHR